RKEGDIGREEARGSASTDSRNSRERSRWVVRIQRCGAIRSPEGRFWEIGGDVGRVSSDGKRPQGDGGKRWGITGGGRSEEDGRVTSLRSRVWRRASRCQIYRRVLDGACLRLLISPVAFTRARRAHRSAWLARLPALVMNS
ncbi:hypothetical protein DBV15_03160, partial [Temnothorax longispinosus]